MKKSILSIAQINEALKRLGQANIASAKQAMEALKRFSNDKRN